MDRRQFSILLAASLLTPSFARSQAPLRVNGERLNAHLTELAGIGTGSDGGTNRVAYSDDDLKGREYAMRLMRDARLDVSIDAAGNILGRRPGTGTGLKPLMIGSHIDSVPSGGSYDGQV